MVAVTGLPNSQDDHTSALDGVSVADERSLRFLPLPTPMRAEVADTARLTANRRESILRTYGKSLDPEEDRASEASARALRSLRLAMM